MAINQQLIGSCNLEGNFTNLLAGVVKSICSKIQSTITLFLVMLLTLIMAPTINAESTMNKRVPAEWEKQEAIWLQWPGRWEKVYEPAFAEMAKIISEYEKLHILCHSKSICSEARTAIKSMGGKFDHRNLIWHQIPNDNAWMRDNGPIYIVENDELRIQNWQFNAWGGAFGDNIPYGHDNRVPIHVGDYLKLSVDGINIVHERG
ncbi:MAG: agmatine deiminase, partial [Gammaproteobacteria bacterium]